MSATVIPETLLINGVAVNASDDVIASPEDVGDGLHDLIPDDDRAALQHVPEEVQERLMEEWANAG